MLVHPHPVASWRRRHLCLALLLALGAPLAAQADHTTCQLLDESGNPVTVTATADGNGSLACGEGATTALDGAPASLNGATALGYQSQAGFIDTADPQGPTSHGRHAFAAGYGSQALGNSSIALGYSSHAEGRDTPSNASNGYNTAIGAQTRADGSESIAIGSSAQALAPSAGSALAGQYGIALGTGAYVGAVDSTAIGQSAKAYSRGSIAIGAYDTFAGGNDGSGQYAIAIGYSAKAGDESATSIGSAHAGLSATTINSGNHTGQYSVNLAGNAGTTESVSIGNQSGTAADHGIAIGFKSAVSGTDSERSVSLGAYAGANGTDASTLGYFSESAADGTAIGREAHAGTGFGSALGSYAWADNNENSALGYESWASADGNNFAAGTYARAAKGGTVLGVWYDGGSGAGAVATALSSVSGESSVALGARTQSEADRVVLLGANSGTGNEAGIGDAVALGQGSIVDRAHSVAVGDATMQRQITHVADATTDTDAINLRQLLAATAAGSGGGGGDASLDEARAYIDAGDANALEIARAYADQASVAADAGILKDVRVHADAGDADVLAKAKGHADTGDAANRDYVDEQTLAAIATAQSYADANDKATLSSAQAYADRRVSEIAGIDFDDYRNQVDQRFVQHNRKINRTGALGAAMAGMVSSAAAARASRTRLGIAIGTYHGESALALGVQHALTPKIGLTLGAGLAGGDNNSISLGLGAGF